MPGFTEISPETVHRWIGDGKAEVLVDVLGMDAAEAAAYAERVKNTT